MKVNTPVSDQSSIKLIPEISGEDENLSLGVTYSIQSVQKPRKGERRLLDLLATVLVEKGIDVLEDYDRVLRSSVHRGSKAIVSHLWVGWLKKA